MDEACANILRVVMNVFAASTSTPSASCSSARMATMVGPRANKRCARNRSCRLAILGSRSLLRWINT